MAKNSRKKKQRRSFKPAVKPNPVTTQTNDQLIDKLLRNVELNPEDVTARLALGDYYLRNSCEEKIVEILEPLRAQYPFDDITSNRLYNRLLAYGYANMGRLTEAEDVCRRGLGDESDGLDYSFLLCFIHLSLREFGKAIENGRKYLDLRQSKSSGNLAAIDYSLSDNHLSQAHNFVGSAHYEQAQWKEAKEQFEASRKLDPGNHLPYINLANIARNEQDRNEAAKILEQGLKSCRQVQELRLLAASLLQSVSISACMIVKDEEELLPECLESIRDWVDEIIIVDTGSTDRTVEIAESYGAKIFHQPWEGNFSKHRNYSLDQATGEWVFIIDADERFAQEDVPQVRRLICQDDIEIISINVYNIYGNNDTITTFLPSVRFWRRSLNLRYEGIVHNLLKLGEEHPVVRCGAKLKHLGYGLEQEKMDKKFRRTKELLEKQLEENPDNFFALFNYAQLLKGEGADYPVKNIPKVIESAGRAVELTDPDNKAERHIHLMCLDQMGWAYFFKRDFGMALNYARRALELKPNYLDALMLKAHCFAQQEDWDKAKEAYQNYIDIQQAYDPSTETDCLILTHIDNRATGHYGLALIAELRKDSEEMKRQLERTLELQPTYLEANLRLANIHLNNGDLEKARDHYQKQLNLGVGKKDAALGLASVCQRDGQDEEVDKHYQMAIELSDSDPEAVLKYARYLRSSGKEDMAVEQLRAAAESAAGSREIQVELGDVYFNLGEFSNARTVYEAMIDQYGPNAAILNNLGNCHFSLGEFERAEECYLKALEQGEAPNLTYRNIGLTQVRLEKYAEAIETLSQYEPELDEKLRISRILADLYSRTGNFEKSLGLYEQCLQQQPADKGALFGLSECYLHMGHRDSAAVGFRRILEIDPDFAPARSRLESLLSQPIGS